MADVCTAGDPQGQAISPGTPSMSSAGPVFQNADPNATKGDWYPYVKQCKTCHVIGEMHGGGKTDPDDFTQPGDGKIAVEEGDKVFYFDPEQSPSWQQNEWLMNGGEQPEVPSPEDTKGLIE